MPELQPLWSGTQIYDPESGMTAEVNVETAIGVLFTTLEPHFNTYFGVRKISVLWQNNVMKGVLYTEEVSSWSQASTVL